VPQQDPLIGTHLGHFKVERVIAVGGMGVIYQATHSVIGRTAAIKVLSQKYSSDRSMIKRLHREARAVNQIGHPNIIDIFDFGQTPDRREYFVMEYIPGLSLAQLLEKHGRLPWRLVAPITTQILDALAAAHDQEIVHRDIKPENILVVQTGGDVVAKILDFGIAKSVGLGPEGENLTKAGVVLGTPEYIAPEQIRGKQVDGRADLYAVGVMLYEMVMGRRPFDSDQVITLLMAHLKQPVPQMEIAPELGMPDFVPAVINRALAKDPEQRFPDARTFARALQLDTSAVEPADGTRPLPQMMWEASQPAPEAQGVQHTQPGMGPMVPDGSSPTTPFSSRGPSTLQGQGSMLLGMQATVPGPVLPTSAFPGQTPRRSPLQWALPLALLLLAGAGVALYFALRSDGKTTTPVVTHKPTPDAGPARRKLDLQLLFEQVRRTLRAGTTNVLPEVRQSCIRGIGELRESDAFALLSALLREDPEVSVRAAAATAIAKLGDPAGVQSLRDARSRSDETMQVFIDRALMRMGHPEGRIGLKDALRSRNKEARFQAALALGEARDPDAVAALAEFSHQMAILNPSMFTLVLGTLARLGHEEALQTLQKTVAQPSTKKETAVIKLGAAEALAKLGSSEGGDTLKTMLREGSPTTQLAAAKVLAASLNDYSGLDQLAAGVRSTDEATRRVAAEGLGSIADRAAIAPLAEALDDKAWKVKAVAAESLAVILSQMPSALVRRSQDWIRVAMDSGDWSVRHAAAEITSDMDPDLAVNLLGWAFRDADPRVRRAAVASLGKIRDRKTLPLLRRALADPDDNVRAEAARALASVGGKEETDALHASVRDRATSVGISAAGALLAMGEETYVKDLKQASRSKDPRIRYDAVRALSRWNNTGKLVPLLKASLKDRAAPVRRAAALRLAELGDTSGEAELRLALKQDGPDQAQALAALAHIGVKPTAEVQAMARSSTGESRRRAMAAVQLLPAGDALGILERGATDRDREVRLAAAAGLTAMASSSPKTIPLLGRLATDADPLVRARASIGLARARKNHGVLTGIDRGTVAPVKEAPLPELPKAPPRPKTPREDKRPRWSVDINSPEERYKHAIGAAALFQKRQKYDQALRQLEIARRQQDTASVHCDMGEVMVFKMLYQARTKEAKRALLLQARPQFNDCHRRANTASLRHKATRGLNDIARYLKLTR